MLSLFRKVQKTDVRAGVAVLNREFAVAVVSRPPGAKPVVEHCGLHPMESTGADQAMKAMFEQLKLGRARVSAVIGPDDYHLVQVEAPDVLPSELRAAVRWRLRDVISFHIDDATVDVFEIPNQSRRAQSKMMFAVAARNDAVKQLADLVAPISRRFDVIDIPDLCLRNLSSLLPQDDKGVALLVLGDTSAQMVLTRQGVLYLTRRIDLNKVFDESVNEAPGALDIDASALALELQRSLDYYESHYDQPAINDLVIAPANERANQLSEALRNESGLRISTFDPNTLFEIAADVSLDLRPSTLLALGAALRVDAMEL